MSVSQAQQKIAEHIQKRRQLAVLTQQELAERSGVPLATLRKFEQKGAVSLESFLKILHVIGGLEELIEILKPSPPKYTSIDQILKEDDAVTRIRRRRK